MIRSNKITLIVRGGVVQAVSPDIEILVKDYDTEGCDPEELKSDPDGEQYYEYYV